MAAERLHDVMVHVTHYYVAGDELVGAYLLCAQAGGTFGAGETRRIVCTHDVIGRYVVISLPGNQEILTICEVQVYGVRGTTVMCEGSSRKIRVLRQYVVQAPLVYREELVAALAEILLCLDSEGRREGRGEGRREGRRDGRMER